MSLKYLFIFSLIVCHHQTYSWRRSQKKPTITIMIDPAGDARQTGRNIGNNFERGLTMQYAQKLALTLKEQHPNITTVITRSPGELIPELQNANYANRLNVTLFISIHFYQTPDPRPITWLYRYAQTNDFVTPSSQLSLYSYDQAYLFNNGKTASWAQSIQRSLADNTTFDTRGPLKLPFKPLVGIVAPAIGFEIGLKEEGDWIKYVEPIAHALITTLKHHGITT